MLPKRSWPGWRSSARALHTSDTPGSSLQHDIIQDAAKTQSVAACARKKLGRWWGWGVRGANFPTAARGADYYHFWARSLPVQGPAQTAALARIPQRSPPPSFHFFLLPSPSPSSHELTGRRRGGEARRPRPDPRLPQRLLLYPQTNHMEPALPVEGGGEWEG